jgi:hypothetical protein
VGHGGLWDPAAGIRGREREKEREKERERKKGEKKRENKRDFSRAKYQGERERLFLFFSCTP